MSQSDVINITDDAMIMEYFGTEKVHVTMGEYTNIKVTTPEDILVVEKYLKKIKKVVDR
jgi:2-C-methyl-D-erythritol 4-phosphate cytidylyltransferase